MTKRIILLCLLCGCAPIPTTQQSKSLATIQTNQWFSLAWQVPGGSSNTITWLESSSSLTNWTVYPITLHFQTVTSNGITTPGFFTDPIPWTNPYLFFRAGRSGI